MIPLLSSTPPHHHQALQALQNQQQQQHKQRRTTMDPHYWRGCLHATCLLLLLIASVYLLTTSPAKNTTLQQNLNGISTKCPAADCSVTTTAQEVVVVNNNENSSGYKILAAEGDLQLRQVTTHYGDTYMQEVQVWRSNPPEVITSTTSSTQFYESLVHPAFLASSQPVQRLLIVGGATGGALEQVLKYTSVKDVTVLMTNNDQRLHQFMQKYLPSNSKVWKNNNNKHVNVVVHDNIWEWLQEQFGPDMCDKNVDNDKLYYDLILFDKLDIASMQETTWKFQPKDFGDDDWEGGDEQDSSTDGSSSRNDEEELPYEVFSEALSCVLNKFGVLAMSMGYGPQPGFANLVKQQENKATLQPLIEEYNQRLRAMQKLTVGFWHQRVYDIPLPQQQGRYWTVALAMVPYLGKVGQDEELQRAVFDGRANGGANDFDDRPAKVNIQLRRKLEPGTKLEYYDGVVQQFYHYPQADWHGLYCLDPNNERICGITESFVNDYEDEIMFLSLEPDHNGRSGAYAKVDIPKGTITGLWDAASDINLPAIQFYRSRHLAEGFETQYNDFAAWVDTYGFDGGASGLGERVAISINSFHNFLNHACDHNPNLVNFEKFAPWAKDAFSTWNPVKVRIAAEIDHFKMAARDIAKGELMTDDYSRWDGFLQSKTGLQDFSRLDRWCSGRRLTPYI